MIDRDVHKREGGGGYRRLVEPKPVLSYRELEKDEDDDDDEGGRREE